MNFNVVSMLSMLSMLSTAWLVASCCTKVNPAAPHCNPQILSNSKGQCCPQKAHPQSSTHMVLSCPEERRTVASLTCGTIIGTL